MLSKIKNFLDSDPVQIFFLLWTAVYLVQIWKGQVSLSNSKEWEWLIGGIIVAAILI